MIGANWNQKHQPNHGEVLVLVLWSDPFPNVEMMGTSCKVGGMR